MWLLLILGFASMIILQSSLDHRHSDLVYEGEVMTFTCTTRGSPILAWRSDEYIGHSVQFEFLSTDPQGYTRHNQYVNATLISVAQDDGVTVMNSTLRIQASSKFSRSSVSCDNVGHGTRRTTSFRVSGESFIIS